MDMNCDQTANGWFEFNTIYSIGGEEGESPVSQAACTGEVTNKNQNKIFRMIVFRDRLGARLPSPPPTTSPAAATSTPSPTVWAPARWTTCRTYPTSSFAGIFKRCGQYSCYSEQVINSLRLQWRRGRVEAQLLHLCVYC